MHGQEGFWRLGLATDGVWWFISPEGTPEFLNTVTTVQPFQTGRDPGGTIFISRDLEGTPSEPGDLKSWASKTVERVMATGFKGLGAWCNPVFHDLPVPITRDLNIWASAPAEHPRLYDPEWLTTADLVVRATVTPLVGNRHLVGYYLDNEMDFSDSRVGPRAYFDWLPADNANRVEVMKVIRELWPDAEQFNSAWAQQITSLDELDALDELPRTAEQAYSRLQSAWLEKLMADYFRLATGLVRAYDPNHLVLGIRYAGWAPPEVIRASRNYTDVQSLNYYVSDALLDEGMFRQFSDLSGQPLIISEYSFHSLDGRSGNRNTAGFPAQVTDQRARAEAYRRFTTNLARVPWVVGADWFQWSDEPPSGRGADGEDVNFGIVDVDDREYPLMVEAVRETAARLNTYHLASGSDPDRRIWREDFRNLPTHVAPRLAQPIRLNGELSDWPAEARLENMHMTQTVGMERSAMPLPNVLVGWRDEGLYVGLEVFDSDPVAAPITERWWNRDAIELWVSTRPAEPGQSDYNSYSHQFMYVPSDPSANGIAGAAGQWHRSGDALKDNLLPHPQIRHNCRILSDRYVVEMFIPASALNGFDPANQPELAFNVHIRNYQHAAAYFWSAPKEAKTQLRPDTWGILKLGDAPGDGFGRIDLHNNTLSEAGAERRTTNQ